MFISQTRQNIIQGFYELSIDVMQTTSISPPMIHE